MQIKAVIVDDEQPDCDEIEYLLKNHLSVKIQGTFNKLFWCRSPILQSIGLMSFSLILKCQRTLRFWKWLKKLRNFISSAFDRIYYTAFQEHALEPLIHQQLAILLSQWLRLVVYHHEKIHQLMTKHQYKSIDKNSKICVIDNGKFCLCKRKKLYWLMLMIRMSLFALWISNILARYV